MRIAVASLIALFATGACAEPAEAPPPEVAASTPAAVAAAPAPPTVQPASTEGAEGFVRALYASYAEGDDAHPWSGDALWSRRMAALVRRDQELATEDPPYLDADPICNCQDWERLTLRSVALQPPAEDASVQATVRFVNAGESHTAVLRLVREPNGWRVDDVLNPGHASLAANLAESNARLEAGGKALYRD